jgi:PilZ domain
MSVQTEPRNIDLRGAAWSSRLHLGSDDTGYFLVLCCRENREVFEPQFSQLGVPFVFASSVEEVLRYGFMLPPLAIVIDIFSATRIGTEKVSGLFNLGVNWPVMRASITNEEDIRIVCLEPAKCRSLAEAVEEIRLGEESWSHPRFFRKSMRIDIRTRARIRCSANEPWRNANLLSISVGGAYLVLGDAIPTKGAQVEVEILDIGQHPLCTAGRIAWRRTWNDGPELPGVGIEFDPAAISSEMRTVLAQTIAPSVQTGYRNTTKTASPTADSVFASIEIREATREFNW